MALGIAVATPAHAQASRTWVSGVGDDANPCSRTAPCKTFAGAISKTAALGEINCLDPGGFGAVTITKSITIDCHEVFASILNSGTNGIIINFDSFTDARRTVRIRNINFNGVDTGLNGIRILGAAGAAGSEVFIEDCLIDGNFGGTGTGITDERTGGGTLAVLNTTVRNVGVTGIRLPGAATRIDASVDNVRVYNASFGIVAGTNVKMMITRSLLFGNTQAGIAGSAGSEVNIDHTVVSSNGIGVSGGGIVRLSNTDIAFNATAVSGATQSFGNNRISGNTNVGTAPTPIGGVSNTFGQQ
ncbi:MAG: right-handed parallel beta-helix repeat-containing protein [Rhodoplanes sp.]|nr:right-handed parallel beta-helix repeat-containing protein [Rhodoplanes sp.]